MDKYLCHYIVEAGRVIGARNTGEHYEISVETGEGVFVVVGVPSSTLDYELPEPGDYFLRGPNGKMEIMSASRFEETHAKIHPNSSSAKGFAANRDTADS